MDILSDRVRVVWPILAVTLLAYLPSLAAGFVYDDLPLIVENPFAQDFRFVARAWQTHFWDVPRSAELSAQYYRPLVTLSFLLDWMISGGKAFWFHLVNIAWHLLATWGALRFAQRWLKSHWLSAAAALVFALHPTRAESVIWIVGRTDVMMSAFALLGLEVAARTATSRSPKWGLLLAFLASIAALLCKEPALLIGILFLAESLRSEPGSRERRQFGSAFLLTAGMAAVYLLLRSWWMPVRPGAVLEWTLQHGLVTVAAYAERLVAPWPLALYLHPLETVDGELVFPIAMLGLGGALLLLSLGLALYCLRRDRPVALLLLGAFGFLGPLLNFTSTGLRVTTSDRFVYLPLLLLAVVSFRLLERSRVLRSWAAPAHSLSPHGSTNSKLRLLGSISVGLVLISMVINALRCLDFVDEETFWQHELEVNPENPKALLSLNRLRAAAGDTEAALSFAQAATEGARRFGFLITDYTAVDLYLRGVDQQLALLPDGDEASLEQHRQALLQVLSGSFSPASGWVGNIAPIRELPRGVVADLLKSRLRLHALASAATVASRLGLKPEARRLLTGISDSDVAHTPSPLELVWISVRAGDLPGASRRLQIVSRGSLVPREQVQAGQQRFERYVKLREASKAQAGADAVITRALADAESGAILLALRRLQPLYRASSTRPDVAQVYTQLLVVARLEDAALKVATDSLGRPRAIEVIAELRQQLRPALRNIVVQRPSRNWAETDGPAVSAQ